ALPRQPRRYVLTGCRPCPLLHRGAAAPRPVPAYEIDFFSSIHEGQPCRPTLPHRPAPARGVAGKSTSGGRLSALARLAGAAAGGYVLVAGARARLRAG
nr:hypothetical protein [Tanacetum cinerariifolium]